MKIVIKDVFLKQMQGILKNYLILIRIYHFCQKEKKEKKVKKILCDIEDKEKYVIHIRALKESIKSRNDIKKTTQSNSV